MHIIKYGIALGLIIFSSCLLSRDYVLIIAGQSNANGRAPIHTILDSSSSKLPILGLDEKILNHKFNRTKVWIDPNDSIRKFWPGYITPIKGYTPRSTPGWENLNINYNQFYQCGWMTSDDGALHATHGIETEIAYSFETDINHKDDYLYIIKWAYGGIGLAQKPIDVDWNVHSKYKMYHYFVNNYLNPAFNSPELHDAIPLGLFWSQGENDSLNMNDAYSYEMNLHYFFSSLHKDVPQTQLFVNYIAQCEMDFRIGGKYADTIRKAQSNFCSIKDNNCIVLPVDNLDFMAQGHDTTFIHLSSVGLKKLNEILYPMMQQ